MPLARNQISRADLRKILDALKKPHDPNAKASLSSYYEHKAVDAAVRRVEEAMDFRDIEVVPGV